MYFADKNSNTLFDFNSWTKIPSHFRRKNEIIVTYGEIIFNNQYPFIKVRNSNGYYLEFGNDFINIYQDNNLI